MGHRGLIIESRLAHAGGLLRVIVGPFLGNEGFVIGIMFGPSWVINGLCLGHHGVIFESPWSCTRIALALGEPGKNMANTWQEHGKHMASS